MAESLFRQTQKRRLELPEIQQASKKQKNDNPSEDDSDGDRPTSPTSRCPICLLVLNNRSYTDTCLHEFCFLCIKQWSQVSLYHRRLGVGTWKNKKKFNFWTLSIIPYYMGSILLNFPPKIGCGRWLR
jgi:Zinc finger, C3HC4 type (RING finger).